MATEQACCGPMFWVYLLISAALVMFAGLMSGLTLGLMSLSLVDLEVLVKAGRPQDRANAARILPVVENQHLLLCTLLICNAAAMEALPIFLDELVPPWGAILISVTLILAFGEIIPQAVCSRYGLKVGAKLAGIVRLLLFVVFPIAYPISKLLDFLLGKGHFVLLRRAELKTLVDMHGNEAGKGGELTRDETTIISGALDLTRKTAKDAMTTISETFSLDINSKLDMNTMGLIMTNGHSRVPIYSGVPTNIIGLILVKNLITCRSEEEIPMRNVTIRKIPKVRDNMPLYDILNEFQKGHSHMAVVVKNKKQSLEKDVNGMTDMVEHISDENRKHTQADGTGVIQVVLTNQLVKTTNTSLMHSNTPGSRSPMRNKDLHGTHPTLKKWDRGKHENIIDDLDSLPGYSSEEEAIGIITMEDLIEELLQEEILDETDEYIDVHNKISINMLPHKTSSPRSCGHAPHFQRTPVASPFSPFNHVPVSRCSVSPRSYTSSPLRNFILAAKSSSSSPARHTVSSHTSPSHRVSINTKKNPEE